jgi:hypothetical protein
MKVSASHFLFVPILTVLGTWSAAQVETEHFRALGGDRFGYDVCLRDDVLIVGAKEDDEAGANAGAVYVYHWNDNGTPAFGFDDQWVPMQKLIPADLSVGDDLGVRVDLFGDVMVMAAILENGAHSDAGAVYV